MSSPNNVQTGKLRAYLIALGVDPAAAKEIVTMGKSREQITADLIASIRAKRHGKVQQQEP